MEPPNSPLDKRRRVVIGFDEKLSREAFDWSLNNILKIGKDHVLLVHVFNSKASSFISSEFLYQSATDDYGHVLAEDHNAYDHLQHALHEFQATLQNHNITSQLLIIKNTDAKTGLTRAANESMADLLIIAGHSGDDFKTKLLGSVSDYCVHHVECPVLVYKHR